MPAFKDELTKEQVWSVVAYAQSLRKAKSQSDGAVQKVQKRSAATALAVSPIT